MWTLETAVDDYMHIIVRTRPWTKKWEEELLTPFVEWLYQQPKARVELSAITPAVVERYVTAMELNSEQHDDLAHVLRLVFMWAEQSGWVQSNPFAATAMA
jgi:hypothetical protein